MVAAAIVDTSGCALERSSAGRRGVVCGVEGLGQVLAAHVSGPQAGPSGAWDRGRMQHFLECCFSAHLSSPV
jgi:hypothetical protein